MLWKTANALIWNKRSRWSWHSWTCVLVIHVPALMLRRYDCICIQRTLWFICIYSFCVMSCFPEDSWHFLSMCCTHHPNNNSSGKSGVYFRRKARCSTYSIQYLFSIICFLSLIVPALKIWRSVSLSSFSHTLHLVLCDRRRMGHFFPVECLAQEHQGDRL